MKTGFKIIGGILTFIGCVAVAIVTFDAIMLKDEFIPMLKESFRYGYSGDVFRKIRGEEP